MQVSRCPASFPLSPFASDMQARYQGLTLLEVADLASWCPANAVWGPVQPPSRLGLGPFGDSMYMYTKPEQSSSFGAKNGLAIEPRLAKCRTPRLTAW